MDPKFVSDEVYDIYINYTGFNLNAREWTIEKIIFVPYKGTN